jgi:hypothetical protein
MKHRSVIWLLLFLQLVPVLLLIAGGSGLLDPFDRLIVESVPLPVPGERRGALINTLQFVSAHWFVGLLWFMPVPALLAILFVVFDKALTKPQRLAWAWSFLFGWPVTVILYCVLKLLGPRGVHLSAVA